ncbi:MAG TPA: hypothetical protein VHK01_19145, partial [Lacipirellulaceae bacterium]|nr:hypothetical protein [Lacipirellulaceae bacterium]
MKYFNVVLIVAAICLISLHAAHAQNEDEDAAKKIAEEAIKIAAVDYLTDREFKLDGQQIVATVRAVDPKEHVKIDLREFNLLPGRVDLKVKITARIRFEGRVTVDEKTTDVRGEANIGQLVTIEAKYWVDDQGWRAEAKATELKFSIAVRELWPEDAAGGKRAVARLTLA